MYCHLVLVGGIQVVPGFWVVLPVPPVNIESDMSGWWQMEAVRS